MLNFAEDARSTINTFLNPLYKYSHGICTASGRENDTRRMIAIYHRLYVKDAKNKLNANTRKALEAVMKKDGRTGPISNQSEEWKRTYETKMAAYLSNKPDIYVHPVMLTFLLMGRPAGREGAISFQSGKAFLDAEAPTPANPTGTYKVGASLQILQDRGVLSRAEKRALTRCEKEVTKAREKATSTGRNVD